MATGINSVTDRHLSLLRAYFMVVQQIDRGPLLIWVPTGWFSFIRVPVLAIAVRVLVSSHIRRVLQALDRAYRRRQAIDETDRDEGDWKKLHEQAKAMDESLTPFLVAKWVFATLAFLLVFLVARSLPHGNLVIKMAGAALTINPGKLAELAAEPGALYASYRLAFVMLVIFIALTPVLIYHFRFKRALFNRREVLVASEFSLTFETVWGERSVSASSIYVLERDLFGALGDLGPAEIPLDLLSAVIAFVYHAIGPGLIVGIIAWHVLAISRSTGKLLFVVAGVNFAIGAFNAHSFVEKIRQRSKQQLKA